MRDYYECDSDERINKCLTCTMPEHLCKGEKVCRAESLQARAAFKASIAYGRSKGMSVPMIAKELDASTKNLYKYLYDERRRNDTKGRL